MAVNPILYMKWQDEIIAQVDNVYNVFFTKSDYNSVISNITGGQSIWPRERFESFLRDRIDPPRTERI